MISITNPNFSIEAETVVTMGNFDGLHRGHMTLINKTLEEKKLKSVVLSFYPHPSAFFSKEQNFKTILSSHEKQYLLENINIDYFVEYPFTKEFSQLSAKDFAKDIVVNKLNCKTLIIGNNCRFGKGGEGSVSTACEYGRLFGFKVIILQPVLLNNDRISSTKIRELILSSNLENANEYLGRNYFIRGHVVSGKKLGRKLGFPTANIIPCKNKLLPPNGVYITSTIIKNESFSSVTNIGVNPTVDGKEITAETFILDFSKDIYGEIIQVDFHKKIREEVKFDSLEELIDNIQNNANIAKEFRNVP